MKRRDLPITSKPYSSDDKEWNSNRKSACYNGVNEIACGGHNSIRFLINLHHMT
jgi:hypothetical protein